MDQPAQCKTLPTSSSGHAETIRQILAFVTVTARGSVQPPLPALDWPRRLFA